MKIYDESGDVTQETIEFLKEWSQANRPTVYHSDVPLNHVKLALREKEISKRYKRKPKARRK